MALIHARRSPWLISASLLVKVFLFGICKVVLVGVLFNLVVCSDKGLGLDLGTVESKSLVHLMSLNTNVSCLSLLEKMVPVFSGTVWMRRGSNCVPDVQDHRAQTRKCATVVFGQSSL